MARIRNYTPDGDLSGEDRLIGSSYEGEGARGSKYKTKTYKLSELGAYFSTYNINEINFSEINSQISSINNSIANVLVGQSNLSNLFNFITNYNEITGDFSINNDFINDFLVNSNNIPTIFVSSLFNSIERDQNILNSLSDISDIFLQNANLTEAFANEILDLTTSLNYATAEQFQSLTNTVTTLDSSINSLSTRVTVTENNISSIFNKTDNIELDIVTAESNITFLQNGFTTLTSTVNTNTSEISTNATSISSLGTRVTTAEANITTVQGDITSLTTTVNTNTGDISSNATSISTLGTRITTAESDISAVETDLTSLTTTVNTNTGNISTNASSISTLQTNVSTNTADITAAETSITNLTTTVNTNTSDISTNAGSISTLQTNVSTAQTDISNLSSDVTSLTTTVNTNTGDIATNASSISTLSTTVTSQGNTISGIQTDVTTLTGTVNTNTGDISSNASDISTLQTRVTTAEGDITAAESDITTLTSSVNTNTGNISTNASNISSLTTTVNTQGTNITNLSSDVTSLTTTVNSNTGAISTNATNISNLSTTVTNNYNTLDAAITSEETARINSDSAITSSVTTLTSTVNGNTSSISTNASAISTVDGKLNASYALSVDAGGRVAGLKLLADGSTGSQFIARANTFAVDMPNGTRVLTVDTNGLVVNGSGTFTGSLNGANVTGATGTFSGNLSVGGLIVNGNEVTFEETLNNETFPLKFKDANGVEVAGIKAFGLNTTPVLDLFSNYRIQINATDNMVLDATSFIQVVSDDFISLEAADDIYLKSTGSGTSRALLFGGSGSTDQFTSITASSEDFITLRVTDGTISSVSEILMSTGSINLESGADFRFTTKNNQVAPDISSFEVGNTSDVFDQTRFWSEDVFFRTNSNLTGEFKVGDISDTFDHVYIYGEDILFQSSATTVGDFRIGQTIKKFNTVQVNSITFNGEVDTFDIHPDVDNTGSFSIGNSITDYAIINFYGNVSAKNDLAVVGALSKGSGSFKIDHPLESKKETHHLVHSFVESPQANNIYRGKVQLQNGTAQVNLDEVSSMTQGTFEALNRDIHVYTTNESDWDAVKGNITGNILTIECQNPNSNATVSWLVIGERQDQHMYETNWTDGNGKVIVEPLKQTNNG